MKIIGYAVCLDNFGYTVSLEIRKIYPIVEPHKNDIEGFLRIIDESGVDYIYPADAFAVLDLSPQIEKQIEQSMAIV